MARSKHKGRNLSFPRRCAAAVPSFAQPVTARVEISRKHSKPRWLQDDCTEDDAICQKMLDHLFPVSLAELIPRALKLTEVLRRPNPPGVVSIKLKGPARQASCDKTQLRTPSLFEHGTSLVSVTARHYPPLTDRHRSCSRGTCESQHREVFCALGVPPQLHSTIVDVSPVDCRRILQKSEVQSSPARALRACIEPSTRPASESINQGWLSWHCCVS